MKKEEIDKFIKDKFKRIRSSFSNAIGSFKTEDIREFRSEIKKLKIFLHLINMESEDGLSYRIIKKMKTIYSYFGIIQNLQLQLKTTTEYEEQNRNHVPVIYLESIKKELKYWKDRSRDFIDYDYDFLKDENEIISTLPELTAESIRKFIDYIFYELQMISGRSGDEALESNSKFFEDIFYNMEFIKPYFSDLQSRIFNENKIVGYLQLLESFRYKSRVIAYLRSCNLDLFDENEKQLLRIMEHNREHEKNEIAKQLADKLESIHIPANHLWEVDFADS